jgi:hypothetical protein
VDYLVSNFHKNVQLNSQETVPMTAQLGALDGTTQVYLCLLAICPFMTRCDKTIVYWKNLQGYTTCIISNAMQMHRGAHLLPVNVVLSLPGKEGGDGTRD